MEIKLYLNQGSVITNLFLKLKHLVTLSEVHGALHTSLRKL